MSSAFRVLPILDTELGVIQLRLNRFWHRFICPEPAALDRALTNAAGPAHWDSATQTLTVRVPQAGNAGGRPCHFRLEPLSSDQASIPPLKTGPAAILIG